MQASCKKPEPHLFPQFSRHPDHGRRRSLHLERCWARRGVQSRHRQDRVGRTAFRRRAPAGANGNQHPRHRLLDTRKRQADLRHPRRKPRRAGRAHRQASRQLGHRRSCESESRPWSEGRQLFLDQRTASVRRCRHDRREHERPPGSERPGAGRRSGVRRSHRQAALDVPCHSAARRIRLRHLGKGFRLLHGHGESVVADHRRRDSGPWPISR